MKNRGKQIQSGSGSGTNRRMYDCDICMRGFTNPQALGGHRNLHRKERESNLYSSSSSSSPYSSSHSFPFSIPSPSHSLSSSLNFTNPNHTNNPPPYFPNTESYQHQAFQQPINPSYNTQRFGSTSSSSSGGNYSHEEFIGLDLSLGLGSINVNDDTYRRPLETGSSQPEGHDLDLDLRLGGHRQY